MQNCQKKWKCYTKDNWLASILATWGLGPQSSSSPFTPGLQSSPPRKGNWSTLRFGNSYLEFGSWNWPACGPLGSQSNPGIFHIFLFVCSLFTFPIRSLRVRPGHLMLWGNNFKDLDLFALDVEIILLWIFSFCKLANPEYICFILGKGKGTIPQKVTKTFFLAFIK